MKNTKQQPNIRHFVSNLAAGGRYFFASREAQSALGVSPAAAKLALNGLAKQGGIASPARGSLRHRPAGIPQPRLPSRRPVHPRSSGEVSGQTYYIGLLSAAQYNGAARHRPQELTRSFLPRTAGQSSAAVCVLRLWLASASRMFRSRASIRLAARSLSQRPKQRPSTLSATSITQVDWIRWQRYFPSLPRKSIRKTPRLPHKAHHSVGAAAWLSAQASAGKKASKLKTYVQEHARLATALLPTAPRGDARRVDDWNLYVNVDVEAEA